MAHGIGAIVEVTANAVTQTQIVTAKYKRLHFGLGNATIVTNLTVYWPAYKHVQKYPT